MNKASHNDQSQKYALSTGRSILVLLAVVLVVSFFVYLFAPNAVTQLIFLIAAVSCIVAIIIFAISKIGKKSW